MFADDIVIWTAPKNDKIQQSSLEIKINEALKLLGDWAMENNMIINTTKTVYQFFSLRHKNYIFNLTINNTLLPKNEKTKYL